MPPQFRVQPDIRVQTEPSTPTQPEWQPTEPDTPRIRKPGDEPDPRKPRRRFPRDDKQKDNKELQPTPDGQYPAVIAHQQTILTETNLHTGEAVITPLTPPERLVALFRSKRQPPQQERWTGGSRVKVGPRGVAQVKPAKPRRRTVARRRRHPFDDFKRQGRR